MVVLDKTVELAQPAPYFGAVMGKNKLSRWVLITILLSMVAFATMFAPKEEFITREYDGISVFGLMLTFSILGGIVWGVYSLIVFGHKSDVFRDDARRGMYQWAATDLRDYLNARYGATLTSEEAVQLLNGGSRTYRTHNGKTEYVRIYLRGIEKLSQTVSYGFDRVLPTPDVSMLNLELMLVEEPAKPRTYEFYQD